jgi:hypothetical protein
MSQTTDPAGRSAAEIENDVERSRARVGATIEALRGSLSPGQMVDQVMDYAKGSGGADFVRNLGGSLRDNPMPVLLIGAGIGWMLLSDRRGEAPVPRTALPPLLPPPRVPQGPGLVSRITGTIGEGAATLRDGISDAAHAVSEGVSGAAQTVGDSVSGAAQRIGDHASAAGAGLRDAGRSAAGAASGAFGSGQDRLRDGQEALRQQAGSAGQALSQTYAQGSASADAAAARLRQGWSQLGEAQPLLLGVLGLAAGAALGALLPRSEAEDRLMGEASDAAARQLRGVVAEGAAEAKAVVGEQLDQLREAAAETYDEARERLQRDGASPSVIGETIQAAAGRAAAVASEAGSRLAEVAGEKIDAAKQAAEEAAKDAAKEPGTEAGKDAAKDRPAATGGSTGASSPGTTSGTTPGTAASGSSGMPAPAILPSKPL